MLWLQINNIVGAGLLSMAWCLKEGTLLPGVAALMVMCAFNVYSFILLARCCEYAARSSCPRMCTLPNHGCVAVTVWGCALLLLLLLLLCLCDCVTVWRCALLCVCVCVGRYAGTFSYKEMGHQALGVTWGYIIQGAMAFYTTGSCISYVVLTGDFLSGASGVRTSHHPGVHDVAEPASPVGGSRWLVIGCPGHS